MKLLKRLKKISFRFICILLISVLIINYSNISIVFASTVDCSSGINSSLSDSYQIKSNKSIQKSAVQSVSNYIPSDEFIAIMHEKGIVGVDDVIGFLIFLFSLLVSIGLVSASSSDDVGHWLEDFFSGLSEELQNKLVLLYMDIQIVSNVGSLTGQYIFNNIPFDIILALSSALSVALLSYNYYVNNKDKENEEYQGQLNSTGNSKIDNSYIYWDRVQHIGLSDANFQRVISMIDINLLQEYKYFYITTFRSGGLAFNIAYYKQPITYTYYNNIDDYSFNSPSLYYYYIKSDYSAGGYSTQPSQVKHCFSYDQIILASEKIEYNCDADFPVTVNKDAIDNFTDNYGNVQDNSIDYPIAYPVGTTFQDISSNVITYDNVISSGQVISSELDNTTDIPITPPPPGLPNHNDMSLPKILFTTKFPFCLPFDMINIFKNLACDPKPPRFEFAFKFEKYGIDKTLVIDLSEYPEFDNISLTFRYFFNLSWIVFLILISRKLIGAE